MRHSPGGNCSKQKIRKFGNGLSASTGREIRASLRAGEFIALTCSYSALPGGRREVPPPPSDGAPWVVPGREKQEPRHGSGADAATHNRITPRSRASSSSRRRRLLGARRSLRAGHRLGRLLPPLLPSFARYFRNSAGICFAIEPSLADEHHTKQLLIDVLSR